MTETVVIVFFIALLGGAFRAGRRAEQRAQFRREVEALRREKEKRYG